MALQKILTRDFILCFFSQFTFLFVSHILMPTLPIYLSKSGSTEVEIGVLIGIFTVSSLLLRPFVGKALSRTLEKDLMIAGAIIYALASVAYLVTPPFWPFLVLRAFQGIGFAFFHTASMTLIANISSETSRGQSLSYFTLSSNISNALAPPLGMVFINRFSFTLLFLVCLGLSLFSLLITSQLGRRQVVPLQDSSREDRFFLNRRAFPPSVISAFFMFVWGALTAFFPLYAIDHGVANPGFFFTTIAVMLILGRALGGRILDLYSKEKVIPPCLAACIVSMVILAFSKSLPMFILVAMIWGVGHTFLVPMIVVYTLDRVGSSTGSAMGTLTAITDLGLSLGPAVMGIILDTTSYPIMFLCLALTGMINLNYFYFFARGKEDL